MIYRFLKRMPPFPWVRDWLMRHYVFSSNRSLVILNFIVQRVIGCNRSVPWPIHYTSTMTVPQKMKIEESSRHCLFVSGGCYYQAANGIEIGENTLWAPGVKMISANHDPCDLDHHLPAEPIRIGNHCWIGANVVILPGVQLGDRVVVGAGAVVTKSFPSGSVIVGNPAHVIERKTKQEG